MKPISEDIAKKVQAYCNATKNNDDFDVLIKLKEELRSCVDHLHLSHLFEICKMVDCALESTDPYYIAKILIYAEDEGIETYNLRRNLELCSDRRSLSADELVSLIRQEKIAG